MLTAGVPLAAALACTPRAPGPVSPLREARAELRAAIDSMTAEPKFRSMQWGILIVDPERAETLYAHNAGKLFIPASNQKLLTGAVALHHLGPDFRFSTSFVADGPVHDGTLHGDLRVVGTGDPTLSDRVAGDAMLPLRAVAESLAARGVRRVTGALVAGGDAFPDAALGHGWSWDDLDFPYSAGVDELFLNEGFFTLTVKAGAEAGDTPVARSRPAGAFPRVHVLATTVARGTVARLRLRHDSLDAGAVVLSGTIAAGDSAALQLAFRDQRRAYLEALGEALRARGITVDGGVATMGVAATNGGGAPGGSGPPREPAGYPLFSLVSPPLRDILPHFEKPSQNQIGEILLKALGRAVKNAGRADSGARVVGEQLLAWGALPDGFVVRDGSGLSRHNVVTPETIVRVLDVVRRGPHSTVFYQSLPVAGVDGTIRTRMRGTAAQGNVHAKTGTLDMVRSLSGYVTTADGRPLLFSVLSNNWTVPVREIEAVQDAIAVRLAQLRLGLVGPADARR
jgi:D-alanyl-D-alanine carboxypeptidase/D-alanyl-D-alanine-endopeptidase (penicillin-binding protein 4)